ncbi:MAG: RNA-dependent RNA polymerase [Fushun levivirus 1]|nr:MAG: RNA-dependent RNA polymerase [Fushun levivirus 1]
MQDAIAVALSVMEGLACPRSLTVAILLRHGEWQQLLELRCNPHHYDTSEAYYGAVSATDLLRKCPDLPIKLNRREAALKTWWEAERQCFRTNRRLYPFTGDGLHQTHPSEGVIDFISRVRKKVWYVLGARPRSDLVPRLGPGATQSDKSAYTTVPDKFSSAITLTPSAWPYVVSWLDTAWGRAHKLLGLDGRVIRGNSYFTVPKTAQTDRSCGKEPSLNGAYQLALGREIRRKLFQRAGIDLDHGHLLHGELAREGSLLNNWATIDLSSASDTVAISLVKLLLPPEWFEQLDALRSPMTNVDGRWVRLEKFSSMGNGFTFELETLIFWAISSACQDEHDEFNVHVFGDDIIVPSSSASNVCRALEFFGFSLNKSKTFISGAFRESCGSDYFNGVAVRPYYIEELPDGPEDWIALANGIRRLACQDLRIPRRWLSLRRSWFRALDNVPALVRQCRGPTELGDIVIHDDPERWHTKERGNCIRYLKVYRPRALSRVRWERFAYEVQFAAALYLAGKGRDRKLRDPNGDLVPRDPVLSFKVGWIPYS